MGATINLWGILLAAALLCGCTHNEVTGTRQFNMVSDEEEVRVGEASDKVIRKQYEVLQDDKLHNYVEEKGQSMVPVSGRDEISYSFTVLDSGILNAFALPGGYIYVSRGLLAHLNSESELMFILGHELSHVTAKHGAQRLSQQKGIQALDIAARILFGNKDVDQWATLTNLGVNLAVTGYGRANELEADHLGASYAEKLHYNPQRFNDFFNTLLKKEGKEPDTLSKIFASHPPTRERIQRISARPVSANSVIDEKTDRRNYLSQIDGIYLGDVPITGLLTQNLYINPRYNFAFPVPESWKLSNPDPKSTNLIQITSTKSNEKGFFKIVPKTQLPSPFESIKIAFLPDSESWKFTVKRHLKFLYRNTIEFDFEHQKSFQKYHQLVIDYPDHYLVFGYYMGYKDQSKTLALLSKFSQSLRNLNPDEQKKWPAFIIKIQDRNQSDTIQTYLKNDPRETAKEAFLLINGLKDESELKHRSQVKVLYKQ